MFRRIVFACVLLTVAARAEQEFLRVADLDPVTVRPAAEHPPVTLVKGGKPVGMIYTVLADHETNQLVRELQDAIKATTGAELPIAKEEPAADQPAIIVGGQVSAELPIEGFEVRTAANRVYIIGHGAGVNWGIDDFLERLVGVRWYWPLAHHGRSVEQRADLVIPPLHYTDAPAYRMRVGWPPYYNGTPYDRLHVHDLYLRLRGGNSWPIQLRVHQPSRWHQVYGEDRPEIFALRADGTRNLAMYCYGDPRTVETFIENIELYEQLENKRDKKYQNHVSFIAGDAITVSPPDLGVHCTCEHCAPLLEPEAGRYASAAKLMGTFVRQLALEVKKRWPEKTIIYLPYVNYTFAPEGIEFPDNVEVQLCGMPGIAMYKEPALRDLYQQNIDDWRKLTNRKVQTWDYACWPTDRTKAPFQYPHVLKDYYQRNRDKLVGTFINGGIPDEWTSQHFTMYCWMKLMWDPEFDVDAAADEFCRRLFGPAAKPMRELLRLQTDRWEQVDWPVDAVSPKALYEMSYTAPVLEQMKALLAAAREATPDEVTKARIDYYATDFEAFFAEAESLLSGEGLNHLIAQKVPDNPVIDGKLDDQWWAMAQPRGFVRKRGQEIAPAKYPTEVRAVWTLDGVTFGLKMHEPNPAELKMDLKVRDDGTLWPRNDNVEVFIDVTGRKEGEYYQWLINPANTVGDYHNGDPTWNPTEAKHAVHIGEDYWSLELYVPTSMFKDAITPHTGKAWAGQFTRHRVSDGRQDRKDDSITEYSRLNNKLGGFSRNAADFGLIKFIE